jgi:phytoene synthase
VTSVPIDSGHGNSATGEAGPLQTDKIKPTLEDFPPALLADSFRHCAEVVRTRARNFYYGLRLTPEPRRSAVYAIYAWMRWGDDRVDEHRDTPTKRRELDAFRARTEQVIDLVRQTGGTDHTELQTFEPFWPAFAATLRSYPIDVAHIRSMLDGLAEDIDPADYETFEQLDRYCYRVASTVGLVCTSIWGYRSGVGVSELAAAHEMAVQRGLAFQLTNILRDFAQDYDQSPRRVYLPLEFLRSHGLDAAALRAWRDPPRCRAAVLDLCARATGHYQASAPLDGLIDPGCRPTLWAMTRIYAGLLELIEADPARIVGPRRIRLSSIRKGAISLTAFIRSKLAG